VKTLFRCIGLAAVMLMSFCATGQVATGTPPFGSFGGGPLDVINLGNLNVHFAIPIRHKAGRGMPFTYDLVYDSSIWSPVGSSGNQTWQPSNTAPAGTPASYWGWQGLSNSGTSYVTYAMTVSYNVPCGQSGTYNVWYFNGFVYYDKAGAP
jgi:hypothetical protein